MTKAEQEIYDQGFMAAAEARAEVIAVCGVPEGMERGLDAVVREYNAAQAELLSLRESNQQLEAGFRPNSELRRLIWTAVFMGAAVGMFIGWLAATLLRAL